MERIDLDQGHGKQKRISLLFGNQKIYLRPVSANKQKWVTADHEEAGSKDLCFLTETTPEEVIEHLKRCGVAIEEGPVNKQGAVGSLKSAYCRDPDGSLIEILAYED
jgi:catechol 2,3-dioxygenase-like lactoylglutathione lyase family enzyme